MSTPKEYVKQRFPNALYVYKDRFSIIDRKLHRVYTIYQTGEIDAFTSLANKLGEGYTIEEAWADAKWNVEVR